MINITNKLMISNFVETEKYFGSVHFLVEKNLVSIPCKNRIRKNFRNQKLSENGEKELFSQSVTKILKVSEQKLIQNQYIAIFPDYLLENYSIKKFKPVYLEITTNEGPIYFLNVNKKRFGLVMGQKYVRKT